MLLNFDFSKVVSLKLKLSIILECFIASMNQLFKIAAGLFFFCGNITWINYFTKIQSEQIEFFYLTRKFV